MSIRIVFPLAGLLGKRLSPICGTHTPGILSVTARRRRAYRQSNPHTGVFPRFRFRKSAYLISSAFFCSPGVYAWSGTGGATKAPIKGALETNPLFVPRRKRLGYRKVIQTASLWCVSLELIDWTTTKTLLSVLPTQPTKLSRDDIRLWRRVQIYRVVKITNYAGTD
jgi:hypothetical protein